MHRLPEEQGLQNQRYPNEPSPVHAAAKGPVIESMVDVTSLLILSATSDARKTVRALAVELDLPIASLYRKVRALQQAGVLSAEKIKDRSTGKETMTYASLLSALNIQFNAPDPRIEIAFRTSRADEDDD